MHASKRPIHQKESLISKKSSNSYWYFALPFPCARFITNFTSLATTPSFPSRLNRRLTDIRRSSRRWSRQSRSRSTFRSKINYSASHGTYTPFTGLGKSFPPALHKSNDPTPLLDGRVPPALGETKEGRPCTCCESGLNIPFGDLRRSGPTLTLCDNLG